jgi:signal transduction histidine kinase
MWFAMSAVKVGDGAALTLTDITERKRTEVAAQERAELARRAAVVDAMVAANRGLAHDLNNLLQSASSHAHLALEALVPPDPARTDLQYALTATRAASALVRRLAIPSRGTEWVHLSVNDLIEDYSDVLACLTSSYGELRVELDSSLAPIRGDQGQLQQVLLNLCLNARDAILSGGAVTVSTRAVDAPRGVQGEGNSPWVEIAVTDTGVGITNEALGRIFEPLFTTKPAGRGSGLGLPTVRAIVERHAGRIDVESIPGKGTTMRVLLPCARN